MPRTKEANQQIHEQQQTKILQAATKVFAEKGKAATMADVVAQAQVSQGLAYRYFESHGKTSSQTGGGPAHRIKQIHGTPGTRLSILVSHILKDRQEKPGHYQLFNQVLADDSTPYGLRQLILKNNHIIQDIIRQLIVEGQESGEIAKDDPDQLTAALMACFEWLLKRNSRLDPTRAKEYFPDAKIILRMLKPDLK